MLRVGTQPILKLGFGRSIEPFGPARGPKRSLHLHWILGTCIVFELTHVSLVLCVRIAGMRSV